MTRKPYPHYYKQKENNRFLKRLDNLAYIVVQVIGFKDGSFRHSHQKEIAYKEELLEEELKKWHPCTEEEYESTMAAFFQFARRDGELFSQYRQKKYERQKQVAQ